MAVEICDFMEQEKFARIKLVLTEDAGERVKTETVPDGNICVFVALFGAVTKEELCAEFQEAIISSVDLDFRDIALSLTDDEVAKLGVPMVYGAVTEAHNAVYDNFEGDISVCLLTCGNKGIFAPPPKPEALIRPPRVMKKKSFQPAGRMEPDSFFDSSLNSEAEKAMYEESRLTSFFKIESVLNRPYMELARKLVETPDAMEETFSNMLFRLIEEKGMTEMECYKKANIDRRLFSKIRGDINYQPAKKTVIAFAFALKLSLDETIDFLLRAGYSLSPAIEFDRTVTKFIKKGNYDIYDLNIELYSNGLGTI
ncbi:MAG: hypothetical protein LUD29_05150 [Clostridia bacterium]|nr:hypothetical protein [Clostridia bacterium]